MKRALLAGAILAAILAVYRPALGAYFYEDDFAWLVSTFTFHPSRVVDVGSYDHFYRPVIELYFWAAAPLFAGSPTLFHASSVALHLLNALLLFLLVREATGSERHAFFTVAFFAGLPGYIEAIAWVGAIAEPISAFFGCVAIWSFLRFARSGRRGWHVASVCALAVALVTHESSVVFLPLLFAAGWAFVRPHQPPTWRTYGHWYLPYVVLVSAYLAIAIPVSARNYVVGESLYRPGFHMVRNGVSYITTLYVGRHNTLSYVAAVALVIGLLVRGNRRVQFATGWMLLGLLPFLPFTWANTSRYLYLPAMGFSMLLAELVLWIDREAQRRMQPAGRHAFVGLLAAAIAVRFCLFAAEGVDRFAERTEAYRRFVVQVREEYPVRPPSSGVPADAATVERLHHSFLESAVQWEYKDPTIRVVPR